ncbi:hypothetical protein RUMLAC_00097 [[Ruminococcus] lactaris ATCC 29176]|uniref:Uncharacterized protein n=1 Tax=[Ruminococcus] lactaris ATCC 29176 TaxID=471875 RepID=B5CKY3_9FIRM|nr:hypothetical protein RUMLAC_00097 [[Ruminococcus] lactaris ATCC 29176]
MKNEIQIPLQVIDDLQGDFVNLISCITFNIKFDVGVKSPRL